MSAFSFSTSFPEKSTAARSRQVTSKSGFTKMILGLAASVSDITETTVNAALSAVTVKQVVDWIRSHLGLSVQGQRQHAFAKVFTGTKLE